MKPWYELLADWLSGLITAQTLKNAGATGPTVTATVRTAATGYAMRTFTLTRDEKAPDGVRGSLQADHLLFQTIENFGLMIPPGSYQCNWEDSPRLGRKTYRLVSVPGRSGILIHPANFAHELLGCISLGISRGMLNGQKAVLSSKAAVAAFEAHMEGDSFVLRIIG